MSKNGSQHHKMYTTYIYFSTQLPKLSTDSFFKSGEKLTIQTEITNLTLIISYNTHSLIFS